MVAAVEDLCIAGNTCVCFIFCLHLKIVVAAVGDLCIACRQHLHLLVWIFGRLKLYIHVILLHLYILFTVPNPGDCNFDGTGNWITLCKWQQRTDDDFDWTTGGSRINPGTGADSDYSGTRNGKHTIFA